jgi:ElaB/YqjD/DUF883 family membrane-anchored ribosome-binding protein
MTTIKESADKASAFASEKLREASERVREASEKVREASGKVRETAAVARERTGNAIEDNPLVAVAGGIALGALVAALLPRSRTEGAYLGSIGNRISEAGRERLGEMGISRDAARAKVSRLIDSAVEAVSSVRGATSRD